VKDKIAGRSPPPIEIVENDKRHSVSRDYVLNIGY